MKLQKLYSKVRQALDDYNMITENDKIAIGVSGERILLRCSMRFPASEAFILCPLSL